MSTQPSLVTNGEIDFDAEPVCLPLEPDESQGRTVPSVGAGNDEQLLSGVREGRPPSSDESQCAQEGAAPAESEQLLLLDIPEWWQEHWKGMPEFKQDDFMPYKTIYVHFESREDMDKFAKLVGQNVTLTTKSVWYPEAEKDEVSKLRWITNPEPPNTKKEELREILDGE